jgi:hypothetical protein
LDYGTLSRSGGAARLLRLLRPGRLAVASSHRGAAAVASRIGIIGRYHQHHESAGVRSVDWSPCMVYYVYYVY